MNADLTPALIAASSGSAMITGIHLWERKQLAAMRASMVRLGLRFPIGLEPTQAVAALNGLSGAAHTTEVVVELAAREGQVTHALWVPASINSSVQSTLTGAIPSLRITPGEPSPTDAATLSLRFFIPTPSLLRSGDDAISTSRSLLTNLTGLRSGELFTIRFCLRPGGARGWQEPENPQPRGREIARGWQRKTSAPTFGVSGLVLIRASKGRARELASHIESVLRGRRGLAGGVRVTYERGNRRMSARPSTTRASGALSSAEILPLLAWPLGADVAAGVEVGGRELRAGHQLPQNGRQLFISRGASGKERPVALSVDAAKHHMAVIGPSGVGKSVLLTRAVLSDISAGFGGAVIDPKADLIDTILNRVPAEHAHRIVVLDAGDSSRRTPGVAVLSGGDPDSRADVLTGTLKAIFGSAWAVRSDFYGRLAIRTLSEIPGASLADMGRLFYEEPYRRAAVARLCDPFLISSWQAYESLSDAAKAEHVQAPMARVMTLLSRPKVRAVLASAEPRLDVAQLFRERKWLLVSLAPGVLSEAGATLVGAALMYSIWSAIEARVVLPPEKRSPIFLYVDELATLTNGLPFSFELLAERARGLGAGLTVALQTLGRIGEPTQSALVGNLATIVSFRAGAKEAPRLAMELPGLNATDLQALGRYEVAARIGTGSGASVSVVTGRTEPLPPMTGQADAIRDASAREYGSAPTNPEVPAVEPPSRSGTDDADAGLGFERRSS